MSDRPDLTIDDVRIDLIWSSTASAHGAGPTWGIDLPTYVHIDAAAESTHYKISVIALRNGSRHLIVHAPGSAEFHTMLYTARYPTLDDFRMELPSDTNERTVQALWLLLAQAYARLEMHGYSS